MLTVTLHRPNGGRFTMNATQQARNLGVPLDYITELEVAWESLPLVRIPFVLDGGDPLDVIGRLRAEIADLREQLAQIP